MRVDLLRGQRPSNGPCLSRYRVEERSLTRLLADQALARPDHPWVRFESGEPLTYGAALHASRRIAARFAASPAARGGPRVGLRVGLMLGTCREFLPMMHGALLAGGVVFLLDPSLPPAAAGPLLDRCALDWLLVDAQSEATVRAAPLARAAPRLITTGSDWLRWLGSDPLAPLQFPRHDADAVVMFTSGTTGAPRAVVASHHYAFLYSATVSDTLGRNASDVIMGGRPLFHASGLQNAVHSALHAGGTALLKQRFSASRFWEDAAAGGATQAGLTLEMAHMILARSESAPEHRLRHVSLSGLTEAERTEFERRYRVKVLRQGYGMTEAYPCPAPLEALGGPEATVGMPMDYVEYGVVDSDDRLLPRGETGELVLRMPPHFMFERYLDDEASTRRAMRGGCFHTGDLMSISADGLLAFRGRDAQRIRHHGENVDPRAIESAALAYPGVREAVAYAVPGAFGNDDVKLDVVADAPLDLSALRAALATKLPKKAVPRYVEQRSHLPRTATFRVMTHLLRNESLSRAEVLDFDGDRR